MNSPGVVPEFSAEDNNYFARGREVFIRLSLLAAVVVSCFALLSPFLNFIICGIIIAVGIYPPYQMLAKAMGGRTKLAATLCSILLLLVIIVPSVLLGGTLAHGIERVTEQLQAGRLDIPPPPSSLNQIPVVGPRLQEFWTLCATDLPQVMTRFGPQIQKYVPVLLAASSGIASSILQFVFAIVLAGFLLAASEPNERFAGRVFIRIFGDQGLQFKDLVVSTIRTVATGILGVAVIQTVFASLGFLVAGLPGAGLWAVIFLMASILQVGALALVPAVLYGFAVFSSTRAVVFLVWCIIVGLMDNILKPILLGRGAKIPMLVIFLGVLGGFMFMNSIIGLFVGAIVLSVGYELFMAWLGSEVPPPPAS
jgi:predicted PurR-regulated permease PerM